MESRLLYSSTKGLKYRLSWKEKDGEEWMYFGAGESVNMNFVNQQLTVFFKEEEVYLVFERMNSGSFSKEEIQNRFESILGVENFLLWNKTLVKAIEFSSIGVLRIGEISKIKSKY